MDRFPRLLTVLLFACALALRSWVPPGWMPTPGAHDFSIMPCPAANAAPMDMAHGSGHQDHSKSAGDCFSPLLAGLTLPEPPPVIAAPSPAPAAPETLLGSAAPMRGTHAPRPFSTGPPLLA